MKTIPRFSVRRALLLTTAIFAAVDLTACNKANDANEAAPNRVTALAPLPAAQPLTAGPATPITRAPSAAALADAAPARLARLPEASDGYAYVDRAYDFTNAIGDAPPDYGFDYGGVTPWVWQAADRSREIVEPVDGGYRYYYYQPGANAPYLVRDPRYSYGFSDGALVAVYDDRGRPLNDAAQREQALFAGRYLARAQHLYQASAQENQRSIAAADWAARRADVAAARSNWAAQQSRDAAWRAYHDEHAAQDATHWQAEQAHRAEAAAQFTDWQHRGFSGAPPAPDPVRQEAVKAQHQQQIAQDHAQQDAVHRSQTDQIAQAAALSRQQAEMAREQSHRIAAADAAQHIADQHMADQHRQIEQAHQADAQAHAAAMHQAEVNQQQQADAAHRHQADVAHTEQAEHHAADAKKQAENAAHQQAEAAHAAQHQATADQRASDVARHQPTASAPAVHHQMDAAKPHPQAAPHHDEPHPPAPPHAEHHHDEHDASH